MAMQIDGAGGTSKKAKTATLPYQPTSLAPVASTGSGGGGPFRPISIPQSAIPSAPSKIPTSTGVGTTPTGTVAPYGPGVGAGGGMSEDEWLAQDAEFNDTRANMEREFANLVAQLAKQRGDYELDTGNAKRNLGWDEEAKGWNQNDRLTGYGNAFQNQQGDFASRGMLDSSLYGGALNDLNRGFERQRGDIETALQSFISGQDTDKSQAEAAKTAATTSAQRQALMRMAAGLGL